MRAWRYYIEGAVATNLSSVSRVAIIGGGPGGLITAYRLEEKFGDQCQTTLFEASHRTGGKIVSGCFDSAPITFEAGAAEFYDYSKLGPDPLLELVKKLGLKTLPLRGKTVILDGKILRNRRDIQRYCGKPTLAAIAEFRGRCAEALPPSDWYEGTPEFDRRHPWASRSCEELLDSVTDESARRYLRAAVHSDLATEPHLTSGLNGIKNFLMDVPGYLDIYCIDGGNAAFVETLKGHLGRTRIASDCVVTRVERNADDCYRVFARQGNSVERADFDSVFVALPHSALGAVEWGGPVLRKAMMRHIAHYDRPGHYLRVNLLFQRPFWRNLIADSWFMSDAFGGCCVYDESARTACGEYGVLGWLIAGTDALSLSNLSEQALVQQVIQSLPEPLSCEARRLLMEAKVFRWLASVNGQPGGAVAQEYRRAHSPEPKQHPGLFMVGDYLFDSTLNGVVDSADYATDLFQSWTLTRRLLAISKDGSTRGKLSGRMSASYFDQYHESTGYKESYAWYFDARYVRDLIEIVWKARPPYRVLDAGSASGLTLADLADCGIDAWGVENNAYIHSQTSPEWLKHNLRGDVRKLPFPDKHFDFVYETCLGHIPEIQLGRALKELRRVTRRGLIFGSLTADMNASLFEKRDLLVGIRTLLTLRQWGELFTSHGFRIAAADPSTLRRLWRCEEKYNQGDESWYPDAGSLQYCFYTPDHG